MSKGVTLELEGDSNDYVGKVRRILFLLTFRLTSSITAREKTPFPGLVDILNIYVHYRAYAGIVRRKDRGLPES